MLTDIKYSQSMCRVLCWCA